MHEGTHRPLSRGISLLAALVMTFGLLAATPTPAQAHEACAVPQPSALGFLAEALSFANVFSSFVHTDSAECTSKEGRVQAVMDRDWGDPEDARSNAGNNANPKSNAPTTFAPCEDGMAADFFPCDGIDMMSHVSMNELGLGQGDTRAEVNDIWGWTDTGVRGKDRDYALLGSVEGTVFVDITDAKRPVVLGMLPTASTFGNDVWRDIKVHDDHAFIVSEHFAHGVQVFDLTRLRDWSGEYTMYDADARYTEMGAAHNIAINEDTGFAYALGSSYGAVNTVTVAGADYDAGPANFGNTTVEEGFTAPLFDVAGVGCDPIAEDLSGTIAIIDRGACRFDTKTINAQDAGAVGVIIVNNQPTGPITLGGDPNLPITISAVSVSSVDGAAIRASLPSDGTITRNPPAICGDGLHMIDVNDPKNPTFAGCEDLTDYVHDTQCVIYDGPDSEHQGKEICFNSNGVGFGDGAPNFFSIVDVSDKSNPIVLSRVDYAGSAYSHQGWLTEDQEYFLFGDEGDELTFGVGTTTRVWDVSDLEEPFVTSTFESTTPAIDHNIYTEGDVAYASNYEAGLRIYDASDPANGLSEIAFFDMYPEGDAPTFDGGSWSNYPYFKQKNIVAASSVDRGLFILRPTDLGDDD